MLAMDDEISEVSGEKSELMQLLVKNTRQGLTLEEEARAIRLIRNPEYSNEACLLCKMDNPDTTHKSIYDTHMCEYCASYALSRQK